MNYRTTEGLSLKERSKISLRVQGIVTELSIQFPSRNGLNQVVLSNSAQYIERRFQSLGFDPESQWYESNSSRVRNLIVIQPGSEPTKPVFVLGAHYDCVVGTPGADDNASGVAALLELARILSDYTNQQSIHFAAFTHEEPPYFYTSHMGSRKYAERLKRERQQVCVMISLEMLGFGGVGMKQAYPFPLMRWLGGYPGDGGFIAVVGDLHSRRLVKIVRESMRKVCSIGVESLSAPGFLPPLFLSDHSSFWSAGYPAIMVTDTAFLLNPNYHLPGDRAETLNYRFLADVVSGVYHAVMELDAS